MDIGLTGEGIFELDGTTYTFFLNRNAIKAMDRDMQIEKSRFEQMLHKLGVTQWLTGNKKNNVEALGQDSMLDAPTLFAYAIKSKQSLLRLEKAEEMFYVMADKEYLISILSQMYKDAIHTLATTEELRKAKQQQTEENDNDFWYLPVYEDENFDVEKTSDCEIEHIDTTGMSVWEQQALFDKINEPQLSSSHANPQYEPKKKQQTISEFLDEMCAVYWQFGLTPEQFWFGDPHLATIARKRYEIELEERDAWQHRLGQYVIAAVNPQGKGKNAKLKYPKKPFGTGLEKTKQDKTEQTIDSTSLENVPETAMRDPHLVYMLRASQAFNTRNARMATQGRKIH